MPRKRHSGVTDQVRASRHRLDDAQALFEKGRWRGCMYVAGYSIECLLKAKLMQRFGCRTLEKLEDELHARRLLRRGRSVFTHELELLLRLLDGLERARSDRRGAERFDLVNKWVPAWRYNPDPANRDTAATFLAAVRALRSWVMNNV
jgi:HEPN domain-containing protein